MRRMLKRRSTIQVGSLFSGIGGLELGLERAGMEVRWQVERDEFCLRVLEKHWPEVPKYGDVEDVDFTSLGSIDLICGGFPCQPFSAAGRGGGIDDDRWLWPHFRRAVRDLQPRYVFVENVPGVRWKNRGALHIVLGDLARMGFDAEWASLRAADFGAPHLRERVFVVGHRPGRSVLPEPAHDASGRLVAPDLDRAGLPERRRPRVACGAGEDAGTDVVARHPGWAGEPRVGRVADGVPDRVDRVRALGNAVVPQVAAWVGEQVVRHAEGDPPIPPARDR